ncbi:hypothetical protein [Azospirillum thermophilum]|uniref:Uncharacterized protein n=1 Tax=Azospirillum thermophilum TaxID=2202148 RepID=A0A2S2CW36_9PROT|nr:hypothetical protein [Azospirillum thermophilum]AWK88625.1 hypothetical protein DEW08_21255 [Azospirillum thermophilum]
MVQQPDQGQGGPPYKDVQLSAMVSNHVRRAVRLRAALEGITVRCLLLRLIRQAGIAEIDEGELVDRRAAGDTRLQPLT